MNNMLKHLADNWREGESSRRQNDKWGETTKGGKGFGRNDPDCYLGSVRGSPNGTIGNFTNGTIGSVRGFQWYHW